MKKLIALVDPKNKTPERIFNELQRALKKYEKNKRRNRPKRRTYG